MPTTTYSGDDLRRMLTAGAAGDRPTRQAAVHLLTFTDLPDRVAFHALVDVEDITGPAGTPVPAAYVRNWNTLMSSAAAGRMHGAAHRLLAVAVSLASSRPVNLCDCVGVGGEAHAQRLIEAIAIATGYGDMYQITPTAKLLEQRASLDTMLGDRR